MMKRATQNHTRAVPWGEVQATVQKHAAHDRELLAALKKTLKTRHNVFQADYEYGQSLVDQGQFKTPCADNLCDDCKKLREMVDKQDGALPVTIVLKNVAEVFYPVDNAHPLRSIPLRVIQEGEVFGVFESLDHRLKQQNASPWTVTAGTRSILILARFYEEKRRRQGREILGNCFDVPDRGLGVLADPAAVIRVAAQQLKVSWRTTVLLLPQQNLHDTAVANAIAHLAWKQSRDYVFAPFDTYQLSEAYAKADHLHIYDHHLFATIERLVAISTGRQIGFLSAFARPNAGPFEQCQKFLVEKGLLDPRVFPAIMLPGYVQPGETGYYFLRYPLVLMPCPKIGSPTKELERLKDAISDHRLGDAGAALGKYEYFTNQSTNRKGLQSIQELGAEAFRSPGWNRTEKDKPHNVPEWHNPFFDAVVRIFRPA